MDVALRKQWVMAEQDQRIAEAIDLEKARLRTFIRRRLADRSDAEDILQEVFYEFVETYRLMKPIEQAGAWLFRVARNRITDLFRKKKPVSFSDMNAAANAGPDEEERLNIEDFLPSGDAGPDVTYARSVLIEELEAALEELPADQRSAFVAHEMEGRSFKEMAAETGLSVNALV